MQSKLFSRSVGPRATPIIPVRSLLKPTTPARSVTKTHAVGKGLSVAFSRGPGSPGECAVARESHISSSDSHPRIRFTMYCMQRPAAAEVARAAMLGREEAVAEVEEAEARKVRFLQRMISTVIEPEMIIPMEHQGLGHMDSTTCRWGRSRWLLGPSPSCHPLRRRAQGGVLPRRFRCRAAVRQGGSLCNTRNCNPCRDWIACPPLPSPMRRHALV